MFFKKGQTRIRGPATRRRAECIGTRPAWRFCAGCISFFDFDLHHPPHRPERCPSAPLARPTPLSRDDASTRKVPIAPRCSFLVWQSGLVRDTVRRLSSASVHALARLVALALALTSRSRSCVSVCPPGVPLQARLRPLSVVRPPSLQPPHTACLTPGVQTRRTVQCACMVCIALCMFSMLSVLRIVLVQPPCLPYTPIYLVSHPSYRLPVRSLLNCTAVSALSTRCVHYACPAPSVLLTPSAAGTPMSDTSSRCARTWDYDHVQIGIAARRRPHPRRIASRLRGTNLSRLHTAPQALHARPHPSPPYLAQPCAHYRENWQAQHQGILSHCTRSQDKSMHAIYDACSPRCVPISRIPPRHTVAHVREMARQVGMCSTSRDKSVSCEAAQFPSSYTQFSADALTNSQVSHSQASHKHPNPPCKLPCTYPRRPEAVSPQPEKVERCVKTRVFIVSPGSSSTCPPARPRCYLCDYALHQARPPELWDVIGRRHDDRNVLARAADLAHRMAHSPAPPPACRPCTVQPTATASGCTLRVLRRSGLAEKPTSRSSPSHALETPARAAYRARVAPSVSAGALRPRHGILVRGPLHALVVELASPSRTSLTAWRPLTEPRM